MDYSVSIESCFDYAIPLKKQMKYVADAGFTHLSLGFDLNHSKLFKRGQIKKINQALHENHLAIDTIHFSQRLNAENMLPLMEQTMQAAKELHCPVLAAHCTSFMAEEVQQQEDIERLKSYIPLLEDLCKTYDMKIALENLCPGKATEIAEQLLECANPKYIGFCYDSSHDQIDGPRSMALLEKWKHRLFTVHISDRIKPFTDHVIMGEGFIDFKAMIEILRKANLDFPFLIEVSKTYSQYKDTELFLKQAYAAAYAMVSKIKE